ncbi:MAG: hypothetical protein JJU06_01865 [Ectothiorhodospiraceae bacterium]|nr:hypothetical protein [Ectothiorhodospiraceae bacterium]MCH8503433.1 hypothetical protein [Ectothiorhodospiraceae bacterium]
MAHTGALLLALLLSACAAVPQSIHRDVSLVAVQRDGETIGEAEDIQAEDTPYGIAYGFTDDEAGFLVRFDQHFVDIQLENRARDTLWILLDDSVFIDTERNAHNLAVPGGLLETTGSGQRRIVVPPDTRRQLRVGVATGSSAIGFGRPLIPIDRHGRTTSVQQAEQQLGKTVSVLLQLERGDARPTYTLTGELKRVNVGGNWIQ